MAPASPPIEADPVGGSPRSGETAEKDLVGLFYPQRRTNLRREDFQKAPARQRITFSAAVSLQKNLAGLQMAQRLAKLTVFKISLRPASPATFPSVNVNFTSVAGLKTSESSLTPLVLVPNIQFIRNPVVFISRIDPGSDHVSPPPLPTSRFTPPSSLLLGLVQ